MTSIREIVERYTELAGGLGRPVALSALGLSLEETQALFSSLDEDYHISRFLHFSKGDGATYLIGAERVTHVSIDPGIDSIL